VCHERDEEGPHPAEAIGSDLDALSALPPTQGAKITAARQKKSPSRATRAEGWDLSNAFSR